MKKNFKRAFCVFLAVILTFGIVPASIASASTAVSTSAAEPFKREVEASDTGWTLYNNGDMVITSDYDTTQPSPWYDLTADPQVNLAREVLTLTIEDGVETIAENQFAGFCSIQTVFIPGSVQTLGKNCFPDNDCVSLKTVYFGGYFEDYSKIDSAATPEGEVWVNYDYYFPTNVIVVNQHAHTNYIEKRNVAQFECSEKGTDKGDEYCSKCNCLLEIGSKTTKAHTPDTVWTITKAPICGEKGEKAIFCTVCNEIVQTEEIPATGKHEYDDSNFVCRVAGDDGKTAPCSSEGVGKFKCKKCGQAVYGPDKIREHKWEFLRQNNTFPKCSVEGQRVDKCAYCGKLRTVIAEHELGPWVILEESVCNKRGREGRYCLECNKVIETRSLEPAPDNHDTVYLYPNCVDGGILTVKCQRCDKIFRTETIPEGGSHKMQEFVTDPTCRTQGYTSTCCTVCGYGKTKTDYTDPKGHIYGEWKIIVPPTCQQEGQKERYCTRMYNNKPCQEEGWRQQEPVEKVACNKEVTKIVPATCVKGGYTEYQCIWCDEITRDYVPCKGTCRNHTRSDAVAFKTLVTKAATEPTCICKGLTLNEYCADCGQVFAEPTSRAALGHAWDTSKWVYTTANDGYHYHPCKRCDAVAPDGNVAHNLIEKNVPATCTEDGYTCKYCPDCGYETEKVIKDLAKGHTPGETLYCNSEVHYKICTVCKQIDDSTRAAHNPNAVAYVAPTCEENGHKAGVLCKDCGYYISGCDPVGKLNHQWSDIFIPTDPTEAAAFHCRKCTRPECNKTAFTAHTFGNEFCEKTYTLTQPAVYSKVCTECNYKSTREQAPTLLQKILYVIKLIFTFPAKIAALVKG